ncbi:hypothetical protein N7454_001686 [Penicillium verhagenii]|nr:hypothetical protein N7454_001686 [Penicillium verhagenii]
MFLPHLAGSNEIQPRVESPERPETDYERSQRKSSDHRVSSRPQYGPSDYQDSQDGSPLNPGASYGEYNQPISDKEGSSFGRHLRHRDALGTLCRNWAWVIFFTILMVVFALRIRKIRKRKASILQKREISRARLDTTAV